MSDTLTTPEPVETKRKRSKLGVIIAVLGLILAAFVGLAIIGAVLGAGTPATSASPTPSASAPAKPSTPSDADRREAVADYLDTIADYSNGVGEAADSGDATKVRTAAVAYLAYLDTHPLPVSGITEVDHLLTASVGHMHEALTGMAAGKFTASVLAKISQSNDEMEAANQALMIATGK